MKRLILYFVSPDFEVKMRRKLIRLARRLGIMNLVNKTYALFLSVKKAIFRLQSRSDIEAVYNDDFFEDIEMQTAPSAEAVVSILMSEFKPESVVDVGCGIGVYLSIFKKNGASVFGIDGSKSAKDNLKISESEFMLFDLRNQHDSNSKYDICMCFEVAEHIPEKYSENLVEILTSYSDQIVFTAAPPGQGGKDHINEKPPRFWIDLFEHGNYKYDSDTTKKLKSMMSEKKVVWYLPENLLVFRRI